ncbi:hypothetical protein JOC34_001473 [Virgibacillus halotolerans]|nr:hypothetical protein [Virgibacillus halotolerans]
MYFFGRYCYKEMAFIMGHEHLLTNSQGEGETII